MEMKKIKEDFGSKIKEDQVMMLDLLNILTYLSSIATANISRDKIFELASKQEGITARSLNKIYLLAKNYGYDYSDAAKLVAEDARHPALKDFLTRLSNALGTGEDEEKFLRGETERMIEVYTNKYQSDVESLKKWTDGYSALLVSVVMVIAISLISTMVFNIGDIFTISLLAGTLFCFITVLGVYVIYRVAPYEKTVHSLEIRSKEQELSRKLSMIILPILGIASIILVVIGVEPWIIFLVIAALLAPVGVVGVMDMKKIEKRDFDISTFLKTLGTTAGTTESTLTVALEHLDKKSVGSLENNVTTLQKRLMNGIKPEICWRYFIGETGSELINRFTTVFLDAVKLGGDQAKIGGIVAKSSLGIAILRTKRKLVSTGFTNLLIPMHAAMTGLLIFIYRIIFSFNNALVRVMGEHSGEITGAAERMPMGMGFFNISVGTDLAFITEYVTLIILILTIADALAAKFAVGGSNYTLCFYASILFFISAVVLFAIPIFADSIFSTGLGAGG
ncbi:MAG: archaellar assembly protein FlaJ [Candidatus Methanospirareceae archaeon]